MTLPTWLTDFQELIQTIVAGFIGFASSYALEAYRKKKTPKEEETQALKNIADAANANVVTTREVIEMLDIRLVKEKEYYTDLINRSKTECETKISSLKELYDGMIEDLQAQILKGKEENLTLSRQVKVLTQEKNDLHRELDELKAQQRRYENSSATTTVTKTTKNTKTE